MTRSDRKRTFTYLFFYLVFSADTWRFLVGAVGAVLLTPKLAAGRELSTAAVAVLGVMLVAIGWWLSAWPMTRWAAFLRRQVRQRP